MRISEKDMKSVRIRICGTFIHTCGLGENKVKEKSGDE